MKSVLRTHWFRIAFAFALVLLTAKFLYPLFAFDTPLGYDPGIYRYLFVKYSEVFPPFVLPELRPAFQEYPMGLFTIVAYFIKAGVPLDWFLEWIWSVMAVGLIICLAWIWTRKEGRVVGLWILFFGLLSVSYYDAFVAMYWKTLLATLFMILTFYFLEKRSFWMILSGAATLLTHNQTGLILGLTLLLWWLFHARSLWREPFFRYATIGFVAIAAIGLASYVPHWQRAFLWPAKSLLKFQGELAPAGSFPPLRYYIEHSGLLLLTGFVGFVWSWKRERGTPWQLSTLVCLVFVFGKLIFYRRFMVQLDILLLPFAAVLLRDTLVQDKSVGVRVLLCGLCAVQGWFSFQQMVHWKPGVSEKQLRDIQKISEHVEPNASVIALENESAVWLLGWQPKLRTGGPGLFNYPRWTENQWRKLFFGLQPERRQLLRGLEQPVYLLTSPLFFEHYGPSLKKFMRDKCFEKIEGTPLLKFTCPNKPE